MGNCESAVSEDNFIPEGGNVRPTRWEAETQDTRYLIELRDSIEKATTQQECTSAFNKAFRPGQPLVVEIQDLKQKFDIERFSEPADQEQVNDVQWIGTTVDGSFHPSESACLNTLQVQKDLGRDILLLDGELVHPQLDNQLAMYLHGVDQVTHVDFQPAAIGITPVLSSTRNHNHPKPESL